ncbi:MAG: thioredoxin [Caldibacillus sp.]
MSNMAIIHATDNDFKEHIKEGLVLTDFWAAWCGPCRMIAPVLEEIDAEMGDQVQIVKIDVDENQATAAEYGVMSIPTLILFKDGEIVDKVIGFRPKEALVEVINKHL